MTIELAELERGSLLGDGRVQDYYVELTEIGKGYLERRFGVEALDRTTDEIRRALLRDPNAVAPLSADEVMAPNQVKKMKNLLGM